MRIGLALDAVDGVTRDARAAEELGFDYVACGEHLFFHGPTGNAFVQLAAAAGATERIRLVSSITLLPLYPAPLAAKLAATLDRISGGRFELGVGSGGEYPPEFEAAGVDRADRFRRVDEALTVLRRLFTGDRISFEGDFTRLTDVALDPPPLQRPGPPVWLGGRKQGAVRRAGRHADVWLPYMVDPPRFRDSLQQVRATATEHGRAAADVAGALFVWTCVDADGDWARRTGTETVSRIYAQDFAPLADRYLLLGTPDDAAARLAQFAEAGADRVLVAVAAPPADRQRVVDTIAAELLPRAAQA